MYGLYWNYATRGINADIQKKLQSCKMWCSWRLLEIPWTNFISNETVLCRKKMNAKYILIERTNSEKWSISLVKSRKIVCLFWKYKGEFRRSQSKEKEILEIVTTNSLVIHLAQLWKKNTTSRLKSVLFNSNCN